MAVFKGHVTAISGTDEGIVLTVVIEAQANAAYSDEDNEAVPGFLEYAKAAFDTDYVYVAPDAEFHPEQ